MGGSNLKDAVKRTLNYFMSHEAQLQINWVGRKGYRAGEDQEEKAALGAIKVAGCIESNY